MTGMSMPTCMCKGNIFLGRSSWFQEGCHFRRRSVCLAMCDIQSTHANVSAFPAQLRGHVTSQRTGNDSMSTSVAPVVYSGAVHCWTRLNVADCLGYSILILKGSFSPRLPRERPI